jgi:hypothetical protein
LRRPTARRRQVSKVSRSMAFLARRARLDRGLSRLDISMLI